MRRRRRLARPSVVTTRSRVLLWRGRARPAAALGAAVDVLQPVDKRSSDSKKRVRPVRPELGGFAKRGDGVAELLLRLAGLPPRLAGLAVDPVQVSIGIPERGFELSTRNCSDRV